MMKSRTRLATLLLAVLLLAFGAQIRTAFAQDDGKETCTIVFLAGKPSHGYGAHEHYAGCKVLAMSLEAAMDNVKTEVYRTDWPDDAAFEDVNAIVMYSDGGPGHPANQHLEQLDALAKKGVGIVCIHYAVETPKGEPGNKFVEWIGGYFETDWSVNPHWRAEFKELPDHPVARGVQPFSAQDEWYYHMRFREGMQGVTPILSAIPPASTLERPDGPHSGNPHVRAKAGQTQHVAWATEREDGGRGFGFTGGHYHWNWGNDDFRKVMLNGIIWTAKLEVPEKGVSVTSLKLAELKQGQDEDVPESFDDEKIREVFGASGNQ